MKLYTDKFNFNDLGVLSKSDLGTYIIDTGDKYQDYYEVTEDVINDIFCKERCPYSETSACDKDNELCLKKLLVEEIKDRIS